MISRFEFLYIKERIKKIENILFEYETTNKVYQAWDRWIHLTPQEKEEEQEKWNKYYKECKESFWGKAFFWLRERFYSNVLVKKTIEFLKQEAERRGVVPIKKPDGVDPQELVILINPYYRLKGELESLKKTYEEYRGVYERNSDNSLD